MSESRSKSIVIEDCMRNPRLYDGCTLCFGRGVIASTKDVIGYVCPMCQGDGIICVRCSACDGKGLIDVTDELRESMRLPNEIGDIMLCRKCNGSGRTD